MKFIFYNKRKLHKNVLIISLNLSTLKRQTHECIYGHIVVCLSNLILIFYLEMFEKLVKTWYDTNQSENCQSLQNVMNQLH